MGAVTLVVEPREAYRSTPDGEQAISFAEMMEYPRFAEALSLALGVEVVVSEDVLEACDTSTGWVLADLATSSVHEAVDGDASLAGRLMLIGADRRTMRELVCQLALAGAVGKGGYRSWLTGMPHKLGDGVLALTGRAKNAGLTVQTAHGAEGYGWVYEADLPEGIARFLRG